MRPEHLQLALRPRSAWEAVELGTMLVRRHAGALWRPWLALSLPVLVLLNVLGWWLDHIWLACVLMWWLLPVFDRIPLYVLSRAVFGQPPGSGETLRAWPKVGPGHIAAHLLWRRFGPWRALALPVDLLEDGERAGKRQRRALIMDGQRGIGLLLIALCQWFVLVVMLGTLSLALLFVPGELTTESMQALAQPLLQDPPRWAQVLMNVVLWLALSLIEPFYIGAGFGLYLNRRVHLEGWDIELALRGLRKRLGATLALALCLVLATPLTLLAQHHDELEGYQDTVTLATIFGSEDQVETHRFARAVAAAAQDPLLHRQQTQRVWVPNTQALPDIDLAPAPKQILPELGAALAALGKTLLWLLLAGLVVLLIVTAPRWWPWMRRNKQRLRPRERALVRTPDAHLDIPLPADISAHAQDLWQTGARRQALALLYRGSLRALAEHARVQPSAAATEAQCLHLSQHLPEPEQRRTFTCLLHAWQRAAYAGHWPDDDQFRALIETFSHRFGWRT